MDIMINIMTIMAWACRIRPTGISDALFGPHAKGEYIIGDGRHGQIFHQHGGSQNRDPEEKETLISP